MYSLVILRLINVIAYVGNSFLFLSSIPLYGYIKICLSIQLFIDVWVVSSLGILQTQPPCSFVYKSPTFM